MAEPEPSGAGGDAEAHDHHGLTRPVARRFASQGLSLVVLGGAMYLLAPALLEVFSSWDRVSSLQPGWLALVAACQVVSFWFVWALQRLVLRTDAWFAVVTSQLAGNAAGRVIPGAAATGAAVQFRLLRSAGVSTANATSGLAAAGLLQLGTTLAMPLVALPALVFGAPAPRSLLNAALFGGALFIALFVLVAVVFTGDGVLSAVGAAIDAARRRLPRVAAPVKATAEVLLRERDSLRTSLGTAWLRAAGYSVGRALFDYLTLLMAIAALGADARPSLVLLAFTASSLLGMVPVTPGGLGFVEAGLTGTLALAGVSAGDAVGAVLLYRLVSFWLPIPIGFVAGVVHRRRFGRTHPHLGSDPGDAGATQA
ncbi:MAG: YbhN family protein [Acidimicrobiales bacterium]